MSNKYDAENQVIKSDNFGLKYLPVTWQGWQVYPKPS